VKTIKAAKETHALAPAVLRQLGGGLEAIQSAIDAANHGADGGFHGFIYHDECRGFVRRNKSAILDELREFGDPIETARGFRCLGRVDYSAEAVGSVLYGDGSDAGDAAGMIYSAVAWFALETVGNAIESAG